MQNKLTNWIDNHTNLCVIMFWSLLILVPFSISHFRGDKPDIYHDKECGHLQGLERDYCRQLIDEENIQNEAGVQDQINNSYRPG